MTERQLKLIVESASGWAFTKKIKYCIQLPFRIGLVRISLIFLGDSERALEILYTASLCHCLLFEQLVKAINKQTNERMRKKWSNDERQKKHTHKINTNIRNLYKILYLYFEFTLNRFSCQIWHSFGIHNIVNWRKLNVFLRNNRIQALFSSSSPIRIRCCCFVVCMRFFCCFFR